MPRYWYRSRGTNPTLFDRLSWFLFCCVVVSLGFVQIRIPIGPLELGLTEILFLLLLPVWFVTILNTGFRFSGKLIWASATVYLLTGLVAAAVSISPQSSLKHMLGEAYLFLLFLVSAQLSTGAKRLKAAVSAWLIGTALATLVALATIIVYYFDSTNLILPYLTYHYGSVPTGNFPRVTATFASASLFFNYASVGIVLPLCCRQVRWISRPLFLTLLATTFIAAVFTLSIGLGSFFVIAAWWTWQSRLSDSKLSYILAVIFVFASAVWLVLSLIALVPYPEAPFVLTLPGVNAHMYPSARYLVWQGTIETIRNSILLGVGPGNPVCYVTFTNTDGTISLLTDAHNTFFSVLAERGIFGAIAFIITLALVIRHWDLYESNKSERPQQLISRGIRFAVVIACIYQGLVGSFEDAKHLWVLMGIAIAANGININEEDHKEFNENATI